MRNTDQPVDVIYRTYRSGRKEVIAIFPGVAGTYDPATCLSYMHTGLHGTCDPAGLMRTTRPATQKEYAPLAAELRGFPYHYRLRAVKRRTRYHDAQRRLEIGK